MELLHHVAGKDLRTREQALAAFYADLRRANGNRRLDPEDFVEVVQARTRGGRGGWDIFYKVPSRIINHGKPQEREQKESAEDMEATAVSVKKNGAGNVNGEKNLKGALDAFVVKAIPEKAETVESRIYKQKKAERVAKRQAAAKKPKATKKLKAEIAKVVKQADKAIVGSKKVRAAVAKANGKADLAARIIADVKAHPGTTHSECRDRVGAPDSTVFAVEKQLVADGKLAKKKNGGRPTYTVKV